MRGRAGPLRRNEGDPRAQTRAGTSRLQASWCRCDCESELKMEIPAQTDIPLRHALVVVTGASTGIGAATARELAKRGFHVLAGVRRDADADAIRSANVEPSRLDITNEAEI